jgi:hypothetical protein
VDAENIAIYTAQNTSGIGPSRHVAAVQKFGRFWIEADITAD